MLIKYCVFLSILESLSPLPRQHSAAIGCTKNYQPIGVTVHSHCVESIENLLQDVGEGGVAVNCKKTQFFLNTLYIIYHDSADTVTIYVNRPIYENDTTLTYTWFCAPVFNDSLAASWPSCNETKQPKWSCIQVEKK